MPYASLRLISLLRVGATGEAVCTVLVNDQEPQSTACPPEAAAAGAAARAAGRQLEHTVVVTMVPGGETSAPATADFGVLRAEAEVMVSIATDGSILECRSVRNDVVGLPAGAPRPPDPCLPFAVGARPVFEPATTPGPRLLKVTNRLYTRG